MLSNEGDEEVNYNHKIVLELVCHISQILKTDKANAVKERGRNRVFWR